MASFRVRLTPANNSDQPVFANYAAVVPAAGMAFIDLGFLEPAALARRAREGGAPPETLGGKLVVRVAMDYGALQALKQQIDRRLMRAAIVILHGANGSGETMRPLAQALRAYGRPVETPDFVGHGGRPVPERYSIEACAEDLIAFLRKRGIEQAYFLGYSFGGYVGLYLARRYPQHVRGLCTLAAKYVYDENTVRHFRYLISTARLNRPGNPRREQLKKIHAPQDWERVAEGMSLLFKELGEKPPLGDEDIAAIDVPALVLSGDKDQIVPWRETQALGRLLRASRVAKFPGEAHPLDAVPLDSVARAVNEWMTGIEMRARPVELARAGT